MVTEVHLAPSSKGPMLRAMTVLMFLSLVFHTSAQSYVPLKDLGLPLSVVQAGACQYVATARVLYMYDFLSGSRNMENVQRMENLISTPSAEPRGFALLEGPDGQLWSCVVDSKGGISFGKQQQGGCGGEFLADYDLYVQYNGTQFLKLGLGGSGGSLAAIGDNMVAIVGLVSGISGPVPGIVRTFPVSLNGTVMAAAKGSDGNTMVFTNTTGYEMSVAAAKRSVGIGQDVPGFNPTFRDVSTFEFSDSYHKYGGSLINSYSWTGTNPGTRSKLSFVFPGIPPNIQFAGADIVDRVFGLEFSLGTVPSHEIQNQSLIAYVAVTHPAQGWYLSAVKIYDVVPNATSPPTPVFKDVGTWEFDLGNDTLYSDYVQILAQTLQKSDAKVVTTVVGAQTGYALLDWDVSSPGTSSKLQWEFDFQNVYSNCPLMEQGNCFCKFYPFGSETYEYQYSDCKQGNRLGGERWEEENKTK